MSRRRPSKNRSRARTRPAAETAPPARAAQAPRGSRLGIIFALFVGLFLGRVFSDNLSGSTLGMVDLVIFAGLAACVALGFRRWARRTVEERERLRRVRQASPAPGASASDRDAVTRDERSARRHEDTSDSQEDSAT